MVKHNIVYRMMQSVLHTIYSDFSKHVMVMLNKN